MSWGSELWDKYDDLYRHTYVGIELLESSVASFVKERGKIEGEYASKLRKLVEKYTPKDSVRKEDEYTAVHGYKQVIIYSKTSIIIPPHL